MAKRTIRYKKPEWREWVYISVEESEVANTIAALEAESYQVEACQT